MSHPHSEITVFVNGYPDSEICPVFTKIHYLDIHFMKWTIPILCILCNNYYKTKFLYYSIITTYILFYIFL